MNGVFGGSLTMLALAGMTFAQVNGRRELTAGETARLEHQESRINREVRNDRAAHGGKLTPAEHARANRQVVPEICVDTTTLGHRVDFAQLL